MRQTVRPTAMVCLGTIDAVVLLRTSPNFARVGHHFQHPHRWVEAAGADAAAAELAGLALWGAAIWLAIGLSAVVLAGAPGPLGTVARLIARRTLPAIVRRVVAGSLGVGIVLIPTYSEAMPTVASASVTVATPTVAASTTSAGASSGLVRPPARLRPAGPEIGWPTDGHDAPPIDVPWPTTPGPATPGPIPPRTPTPPRAPTTPTPQKPTPTPTGVEPVTVRAGDSLWLIAARRLGPSATAAQIAAAWPAWYRANSPVIGSDPSLVHVGQVLFVPGPGSTQ